MNIKKLLKFNSFKTSFFITILVALLQVATLNSFSLLMNNNPKTLIINGLFVALLYLISCIIMFINEKQKAVSSYYFKRQANQWIDDYYVNSTFSEFEKSQVGEKASVYVNDVLRVSMLMLEKLSSMIFSGVVIIFSLIALFFIHWQMFLLGGVFLLIMMFLPKLFNKGLSKAIMESQVSQRNFLSKITEILNGFSIFVENNVRHKYKEKSEFYSHEYALSVSKINTFAGVLSAVLTFITTLFTITSLVGVGILVINGKVESGKFLSVLGILPFMGEQIAKFTSDKSFYNSGKDVFKENLAKMETSYNKSFTKPFILMPKNFKASSKIKQKPNNGCVEIKTSKIIVPYKDNPLSIKDVEFKKNKKYLIIGKSGCGKSTLLKVITGEINNYDGKVLVDGIEKSKDEELFNKVAYVRQENFLFNDTLENNIIMGNPNADAKSLLEIVGLSNFSKDMIIEENGKNLSGGQRQRIALARALALNRKILILDEVIANLDQESSEAIINVILNYEGMVILISHQVPDKLKNGIDEIVDLSL